MAVSKDYRHSVPPRTKVRREREQTVEITPTSTDRRERRVAATLQGRRWRLPLPVDEGGRGEDDRDADGIVRYVRETFR